MYMKSSIAIQQRGQAGETLTAENRDCSQPHLNAGHGTVPKAMLREMLKRMLMIRLFEESTLKLYAASRMPGFVHIAIGQEAEIVGACMALRNDDYITGNHRSHGHPIAKGAALAPLMAELLGKKTGVCRGKGGSMHLAVFSAGSLGESGIVGSLMPVAVGAALSATLRGTDQVCVCFFGDGAANCGPFHESLNLAAIWKLPVIFLCENNGYAATTPKFQTTPISDIATRAGAYGIPGVVVDGQDIIAVYNETALAVARARAGDGPTLVEAKTYRYRDHSETPGKTEPTLRSDADIPAWQKTDPIEKFSRSLLDAGDFASEELEAIRSEVQADVEMAVAFAEKSSIPTETELFEDVFIASLEEEQPTCLK